MLLPSGCSASSEAKSSFSCSFYRPCNTCGSTEKSRKWSDILQIGSWLDCLNPIFRTLTKHTFVCLFLLTISRLQSLNVHEEYSIYSFSFLNVGKIVRALICKTNCLAALDFRVVLYLYLPLRCTAKDSF